MTPASKAAADKEGVCIAPDGDSEGGAGEEGCVRKGGAGGQEGRSCQKKYPAHKESCAHKECSGREEARSIRQRRRGSEEGDDPDQEGGSDRQEGGGAGQEAAPASKPAGDLPVPVPEAEAAPVAPPPVRSTFTPKPKPPAPVRPKTGPYAKDVKFLEEISELLAEERAIYQEQATSLRAEADSLALEREPGDVQFDEESGEGGDGHRRP